MSKNNEESIIEVKDLSKSFGDHEVLRKIDFEVKKGEVICILGSSGSGKSTLLRCVNKLETQTSGQVLDHEFYLYHFVALNVRRSGMSRRRLMSFVPELAWCSSPSTYLTI